MRGAGAAWVAVTSADHGAGLRILRSRNVTEVSFRRFLLYVFFLCRPKEQATNERP
jgi:hypothetical protein